MKILLFLFCLLPFNLLGQPHQNFPPGQQKIPFESEVISIPRTDGEYSLYYTYKIPYKLLVFERENDLFNTVFRAIIEIKDENENLVVRDIKDSKVEVNTFESTSDPNLFLQDYLKFTLAEGEYSIFATISDLNSEGELRIKPEIIELVKNEDKLLLHPFLIKAGTLICNDMEAFLLANTGGNVPFSNEIYHLVIPVKDTLVNELKITIENNDETIVSGMLQESYTLPIDITKCDDKLAVTKNNESITVKIFVVKEVNKKVKEGRLTIQIENDDFNIDEEYESRVIWFGKPFSLMNPEKAIEFLGYIESDSVVYNMLDADEDEYQKILVDYWKKFDPTPESTFNEIMFEYYNRVDYAMKEFRGLSKDNGAKTDRGIVYIKFGKPDEIKRSSNPQGQVVEIWTYQKQVRNFSFVDKRGTGNFTLIDE